VLPTGGGFHSPDLYPLQRGIGLLSPLYSSLLDPTKAAAETVLAVDPEEEIAVQTVETDPLGIYPSSDSCDDSDFDALKNDVNDGVLLDEDEWRQ
jgi:hypothetical protein